jgi:hypothetical protein
MKVAVVLDYPTRTVVTFVDWEDREQVRTFAKNAEACLREGGTVISKSVFTK